MFARSSLLFILLAFITLTTTACPGGSGSSPLDKPDAAPPISDAPPQPTPDAAPLKGYGQPCANAGQCASGLCIGETGSQFVCSIPCNIDIANDCRAVDGFCVPIGGDDHACYRTIETLNDLDDAILAVGDSTTRAVTPLDDADMFQVRLNQLGTIRFTVTPTASIDVKLEGYGMLGDALGSANDGGAGLSESLQTTVQQLGSHMFLVVRNVGQSTGNYTFTVTKIAPFGPVTDPSLPNRAAVTLESAP